LFGGSFPNLLRTLTELPTAWNTQLPSVDAPASPQLKKEDQPQSISPTMSLLGAPPQARPVTSLTNLLKQAKQRSIQTITSSEADDEWDTDPDFVNSDDSSRGETI